jgi:hypothetical protein
MSNKKVHFFVENKLKKNETANKKNMLKKKTQSTGDEEGAQKVHHQEIVVSRGLKKNSRAGAIVKRKTMSNFMDQIIKDRTVGAVFKKKQAASLKKFDTIQSRDMLSKPSNFSMYKQKTLFSRGSDSRLNTDTDEKITIPRFETRQM